jgi:DNA-binding beta-propeller fold protein YncE
MPWSPRLTVQLNDTTYFLLTTPHAIRVHRVGTGEESRAFESPHDIWFSPQRHRATAYYAYTRTNGIPVFGVAAGDTVFTLRGPTHALGAAYSADGDTMFVLAGYDEDSTRLLAVDASSGALYRSLALANGPHFLAADPAAPWIYVFGWIGTPTQVYPNMAIIHRGSFTVVATVIGPVTKMYGGLPPPGDMCWDCFNRLFIDAASNTLYVVGVEAWDRFSQPPPLLS